MLAIYLLYSFILQFCLFYGGSGFVSKISFAADLVVSQIGIVDEIIYLFPALVSTLEYRIIAPML